MGLSQIRKRMSHLIASDGISNGPRFRKQAGNGLADQPRKTFRFGGRNLTSELRDAVVASPFIIERRIGALFRFLNKALIEHALDGTVECAGTKPHLAIGTRGNVLHNAVAVTLTVSEGNQDLKKSRWKGKKLIG
jgi:hypothetical protein